MPSHPRPLASCPSTDSIFQICRARAQVHRREHPRLALVPCFRMSVRTGTRQHGNRRHVDARWASRLQRESDRAGRSQGFVLDRLDQEKRPQRSRSTETHGSIKSRSHTRYLHLQGLRRQSLRSLRSPMARERNLRRVPSPHQRSS